MSAGRVWLQRLLLVVGFGCLGWYAAVTLGAGIARHQHAAEFERLRAAAPLLAPPPRAAARADSSVPGLGTATTTGADTDLIGLLEIPRLSLSTPVIRGDDASTLEIAVGHLPDTPRPWEAGNSAMAGHRDGLFRPLKHIRTGDEILVRTTRGDLRYRVRDTRIVAPDDLSVLRPTDMQTLTLITCYPFNFVGAAPRRFVVHAERVEERAQPEVRVARATARVAPTLPSAIVSVAATAPAELSRPRRTASAGSDVVAGDKTGPRIARAKSKSKSKPKPKAKAGSKAAAAPAAKPGKARRFFRKLGAFFTGAEQAPAPKPRR